MKLAFIGGGTMAEAMIRGILSQGVATPEDICVGEMLPQRCQALKERHSVGATPDNLEAIVGSSMVVLAVKPQSVPEVLPELRGHLTDQQVVMSIVAGTRMSTIKKGLEHQLVIRVMPNTPAQIGEGVSLWTSSAVVSESQRLDAEKVLKTMGRSIYSEDEKYLDMATALSASGPAYVFTFIEGLIDAGVYIGLPRDLARNLALETVLGSAKLVEQTGQHPAELRDMVTSPGGTTAEALLALEEGGFRAAVYNAVIAAYEKSGELGQEE